MEERLININQAAKVKTDLHTCKLFGKIFLPVATYKNLKYWKATDRRKLFFNIFSN